MTKSSVTVNVHEAKTHLSRIIEQVLLGADTPATWVVLANAAAALMAAGRVSNLREGVAVARTALQAGGALHVLEKLRKLNTAV